jgi:hypothetical protein
VPRKKKPLGHFVAELLTAGERTASGNVYSMEILEKLKAEILGKPVTVEEVSPVERRAKKVPVCFSWPERAMAESTSADIVDNTLVVGFDIKDNRYGKLLKAVIDEHPVKWKPVGVGDTDADGNVTDYKISYVTFGLEDGQA